MNSANRQTEKNRRGNNFTSQGPPNLAIPCDVNEANDDSGSSLASSDSDYLFKRETQIERKKNKRQSVQVTVPREIVEIKRVTDDQAENNHDKVDNQEVS